MLILPLNLAYGSSTNLEWFQFDIDFNGGTAGWPNNIWWGIWNVDAPSGCLVYIPSSNYHPNTIGLTYTIGHTYHYQGSIVSGKFRFQIWDDTAGTNWYKDFSVPSTNQVYDSSCFSPASAVEGYTTPSTVSNVPYYGFTVGYGMTWYSFGQYGSGVPSGLSTNRWSLGGSPSTWHWEMTGTGISPFVGTDKTTYAQGEYIQFTGSGFTPGGAISSCISTGNVAGVGLCVSQPNAGGQGNVGGSMQVETNIPAGPQKFWVADLSTGRNSNAVQLTITSPVTVTITRTVTSTVSSTSYTTRYTTSTLTSYTSTYTSTSTIPTFTTVVLVPVTVTSTVQSTQYVTSTRTTTVTSYTGTQASTSTVLILTTVVLVPLTVTSTVQSIQYLASVLTTTVTSYTSTQTSTSTIPTVTTVALVPLTVTSTIQSTQFLTSTATTTVTSYTATTTLTSTELAYTTVTATGGGAGASPSGLATPDTSALVFVAGFLVALRAFPREEQSLKGGGRRREGSDASV